MPTYAQLQAEAIWRQEVVTDELKWLVDALCDHFGVPRTNGGTKGNNVHLNGGHRSQRWILNSRWCTNRTYSVETRLPAAFLDGIAAFDVTLPPAHMLTISRNADGATRAGLLEELVEWFGNVNGDQRVDGWNNIENRVASSDSSHLWHFHGRIRRSKLRDMTVMRRIFSALTGGTTPAATPAATTGDIDMAVIAQSPAGQLYLCNGITSRPITEAQRVDIQYLAGQGMITLGKGSGDNAEWTGGGLIRKGWSEAVFGPVVHDATAVVDLDVLDALAAKVTAKVGDTFAELVAGKVRADIVGVRAAVEANLSPAERASLHP